MRLALATFSAGDRWELCGDLVQRTLCRAAHLRGFRASRAGPFATCGPCGLVRDL